MARSTRSSTRSSPPPAEYPKPTRGRPRTFPEGEQQLVVRLPAELGDSVEIERRRMQSERPGSNISRSEALRVLILEAVAARNKGPKTR